MSLTSALIINLLFSTALIVPSLRAILENLLKVISRKFILVADFKI